MPTTDSTFPTTVLTLVRGIARPFSRRVKGFAYAPNGGASPLSGARGGVTVSIVGPGPPWLVVYHALESVIIPSQWPGRLWRAEVLEPVTAADVRAAGAGRLSSDARYTRAISLRVIEEWPLSALFGPHGAAVCTVIAAAGRLELDQVRALAAARHPDAESAYSRAWNTWLTGERLDVHAVAAARSGTWTVRVGGRGSPINGGFRVLSSELTQRARTRVGESAFLRDDEGEPYLEPTWQSACNVLLDAAMAFGAPELSGPHDAAVLAAGWRAVLGSDPMS